MISFAVNQLSIRGCFEFLLVIHQLACWLFFRKYQLVSISRNVVKIFWLPWDFYFYIHKIWKEDKKDANDFVQILIKTVDCEKQTRIITIFLRDSCCIRLYVTKNKIVFFPWKHFMFYFEVLFFFSFTLLLLSINLNWVCLIVVLKFKMKSSKPHNKHSVTFLPWSSAF